MATKFGRMALTITFSVAHEEDEVVTQETTIADLITDLYNAANANQSPQTVMEGLDDFIEDVSVWHSVVAYAPDEQELSEEGIESLDKNLIHQMALDKAQQVLSSPQTMQAMLLTFSKLISTMGQVRDAEQEKKEGTSTVQ